MKTSRDVLDQETPDDQSPCQVSSPTHRILVVEDDTDTRKLYSKVLNNLGYQVDTAEDGEAGWKLLQHEDDVPDSYDLVITDNKMPKLAGIELIKKLHNAHPQLPVILASGSVPEELAHRPDSCTTLMLPKPFGIEKLLDTVKKVLGPSPEPESSNVLRVERYTPVRKLEWDRLVATGKNATFLFQRDYMDYHQERFMDYSLLIFERDKVVGLIPGNLSTDGTLISHEGLTYGGLVVPRDARLKDVVKCFHAVLRYLNEQGISKWIYKRLPGFYNTLPDDDVPYALFLMDARLFRRDCATTICELDRLPLNRNRKVQIKKARAAGVQVVEEKNFQPFWDRVLIPQLAARYGARPVHTLDEIALLSSRFPQHIKQFSVYTGDEILGGTTIYETRTVAHAQYSAVTEKGRQTGAQAYLFNWLIDKYKDKHFFDFGTSNENEGRAINYGLLIWKEGFGARCFTHDFYEISTANYTRLDPILQGLPEIIPNPEKKAEVNGLSAAGLMACPCGLAGEPLAASGVKTIETGTLQRSNVRLSPVS